MQCCVMFQPLKLGLTVARLPPHRGKNRLSEDGGERDRDTPELWWELESNMGMCVSDVVTPFWGVKHSPQITQSGSKEVTPMPSRGD